MPNSSVSVVATGPKKCKPMQFEFMLQPPSSNFKIEMVVEKNCTPENDAVWKLVFDLYKKIDGSFTQIVHISYKAGNSKEVKGIKSIAIDGINDAAASVAIDEVLPLAEKAHEPNPPADLNAQLKAAMKKVTIVQLED